MSDSSGGPGWWLASDGRWYPPELHPSALSSSSNPPSADEGAPLTTEPSAAPADPPAASPATGTSSTTKVLLGVGCLGALVAGVLVLVIVAAVVLRGGHTWSDGTRATFVSSCMSEAGGTSTQCRCIADEVEAAGVTDDEITLAMATGRSPAGRLRDLMTSAALACR